MTKRFFKWILFILATIIELFLIWLSTNTEGIYQSITFLVLYLFNLVYAFFILLAILIYYDSLPEGKQQ